jgi:hypothetical protein
LYDLVLSEPIPDGRQKHHHIKTTTTQKSIKHNPWPAWCKAKDCGNKPHF